VGAQIHESRDCENWPLHHVAIVTPLRPHRLTLPRSSFWNESGGLLIQSSPCKHDQSESIRGGRLSRGARTKCSSGDTHVSESRRDCERVSA
jgi:hypothetical protein